MAFPDNSGSLLGRDWAAMAFTSIGETLSHVGKGPKNYTRTDQRVYEDVCERLTEHGDVDASDIEVQVKEHEVTLSGTVSSKREKRLAEDIAASVKGVHDVHNRLKIKEGPASMLGSLARSGVTAII